MSDQENSSERIAETLRAAALVESATKKPTPPLTDVTEEENTAVRQKSAPATTKIPSERHKHAAKKLSSNPKPKKRREASPARVQTSIETDLKMDEIVVMSAPIQPMAILRRSTTPIAAVPERSDEKDEIDSISSEIKELRTAEPVKGASEWHITDETNEDNASIGSDVSKKKDITWSDESYLEKTNLQESCHYRSEEQNVMEEEPVPLQRKLGNEELTSTVMDETIEDDASTSSEISKKKEITWSDESYLKKVNLQIMGARSSSWMLERKASVGPCYRQSMPFGEPSGITVCLPKKPIRYASCVLGDCQTIKSGISINIAKKPCESKLRLFGPVQFETRRVTSTRLNPGDTRVKEDNYTHYSSNLKGKLDNLYGRIKHAFHI